MSRHELATLAARNRGRGTTVRCPAHDDLKASLSVSLGVEGHILLHCHAGCPVEQVVAALGLRIANLMPEGDACGAFTVKAARVAKTIRYEIRNAARALTAVHIREELSDGAKRFRWERNGESGLSGLPVSDVPLYGTELVGGWRPEIPIFLTEGEAKCDVLRVNGFYAVATATGAAGTPSEESLGVLHGRNVLLWRDLDDAGRGHMERIAARLHGKAQRLRLLEWGTRAGDDAANFFARSGTREQLRELCRLRPDWAPPATGDSLTSGAKIVRLSDVKPESVSWLWSGRVPFGKLAVFDGDPGLGKSTVTLDLAARLTTGRVLPNGEAHEPANVVILSAEDGLGDTIRPRLEAAGANLARVVAIPVVIGEDGVETMVNLTDHVGQIEETVRREFARLVIIDPLMAYLGRSVDSHRDQDVRGALAPLAALAERTGAAVVLVRHLRKGSRGDGALYAGGGSIGIAGAARSVLLFGKDPDVPERRIVAAVKSNLCRAPKSLAYQIDLDLEGRPFIAWENGTVDITADRLITAGTFGDEDRTARGEAEDFLRGELASGPRAADEICETAGKAGIKEATLRRARAALGVISEREGFGRGGRWTIRLPEPKRLTDLPKARTPEGEHLCREVSTYGTCSYHVGATADPCGRCGRAYADHITAEQWDAEGFV